MKSEEKACNLHFVNSVLSIRAKMILKRARLYRVDVEDGRCSNAAFVIGGIAVYRKLSVVTVSS